MNDLSTTHPLAARLPERAVKYAKKSKAKNTITAYTRCWNDFLFYCEHTAHAAHLPCSPETVCDYVSRLADDHLKVSTIQQRLAAISYFHARSELADPTKHPFVRTTMEGIRRDLGTAPAQQAPLLRADVRHLALLLDDDLCGLRDRAILLLGFAGAFRESELAALTVADLKFTDTELFVLVRRSKTDQEGAGQTKQVPMLSPENALFCPVLAMRAWLTASEITTGAVFRKVDRWGKVWHKALRPAAIAYIIQRTAEHAGLDKQAFAGHSLRSGFVTQAAQDDIPLHEIQEITGHKSSDMVRRYIRNQGIRGRSTIKKVLGE